MKPRGSNKNSSNSPRKFLQLQNESKIVENSITDARVTPTHHVKACSTTKHKSDFDSVLSGKANIKSNNQSPDSVRKKDKGGLRVCSVLDNPKDMKASLMKNDTSTMVNRKFIILDE